MSSSKKFQYFNKPDDFCSCNFMFFFYLSDYLSYNLVQGGIVEGYRFKILFIDFLTGRLKTVYFIIFNGFNIYLLTTFTFVICIYLFSLGHGHVARALQLSILGCRINIKMLTHYGHDFANSCLL